MYEWVTHTWNAIKGICPHDCAYCYMKRFPLKEPRLDEKEMLTDLGHDNFIFIDAPPILPVADASEIATMVDGVFLVYKVGKIGRGVLKRAKSNLENVDAKLLGVILNGVKSDEGPEYYKYHSHYYYGQEIETKNVSNIKSIIQKISKPIITGKRLLSLMLILGIVLFIVVIFRQHLGISLPDWLLSYKNLFSSN